MLISGQYSDQSGRMVLLILPLSFPTLFLSCLSSSGAIKPLEEGRAKAVPFWYSFKAPFIWAVSWCLSRIWICNFARLLQLGFRIFTGRHHGRHCSKWSIIRLFYPGQPPCYSFRPSWRIHCSFSWLWSLYTLPWFQGAGWWSSFSVMAGSKNWFSSAVIETSCSSRLLFLVLSINLIWSKSWFYPVTRILEWSYRNRVFGSFISTVSFPALNNAATSSIYTGRKLEKAIDSGYSSLLLHFDQKVLYFQPKNQSQSLPYTSFCTCLNRFPTTYPLCEGLNIMLTPNMICRNPCS